MNMNYNPPCKRAPLQTACAEVAVSIEHSWSEYEQPVRVLPHNQIQAETAMIGQSWAQTGW